MTAEENHKRRLQETLNDKRFYTQQLIELYQAWFQKHLTKK